VHLTQRYAQHALRRGQRELRLGEVDQFPEGVREKGPILRYAYNSAHHHPVSHILPSEHVRPPSGEILGSDLTAAVTVACLLEGKDP
jgi:hypothetical protein